MGFQVGYLVITMLVGVVVLLAAYKTNKLDVESVEDGVELEEGHWGRSERREGGLVGGEMIVDGFFM